MKKRVLLIGALLSGCAYESAELTPAQESPLVITEVATNNCTGLVDAYGKTSNWIELQNRTEAPLNLGDYYLSDDREKPQKWRLGERILEPGAYEVVHTSGRDYRDTTAAPPRCEVRISSSDSWADGYLEGGTSWVKPYAFANNLLGKNSEGNGALSASLFYGDCLEDLGWEGMTFASAMLRVADASGENYLSLDKYTHIEIRGYFSKGKTFKMEYLLDGWGDSQEKAVLQYSGPSETFVGTGEEDGLYRFQVNRSEMDYMVDLKQLHGLRFTHHELEDTLNFTLNHVYFSSIQRNFHSSFKLASTGDELYVSNADGTVLDSLYIPALSPDISYGRDAQGEVYFTVPTPGMKNEVSKSTILKSGTHQTPGGFYDKPVTVSLVAESGTTLYYTIDGSTPTVASNRYNGPFVLDQTAVVRTVALKDGAIASAVTSETYFINEPTKLPVVAITVDHNEMFDSTTGMYMPGPRASKTFPHYGGNFWDKNRMLDAHMEFYEEGHKRAFARPMGLKIHGGWSRGSGKKSLGLMFKEQYGEGALEYPIFPDYPAARRFKSLILRMGGDHGDDIIVYDGFNSYLTKGRDLDYQKMRSVKLFINGRYWGLYNIREKLNEHFFDTNYGIGGDEVSMLKDGGIIQQGSADDYIKMINYLRFNNPDTEVSYEYIKGCMDVCNFIDYMATQIFIVNNDWPANNMKWWKSTRPGSKWRWVIYDTDGAGLEGDEYIETNMIDFVTTEDPDIEYPNGYDFTFLFRRLLKNDEFKADFINRSMTLLNTNFTPQNYKAKLDYLLSFIGDEYKRDFTHWGIDESRWTDKLASMRRFADRRPTVVRENMKTYFELSDPVTVQLSSEHGEVTINGMSAGSSLTGLYYADFPLDISVTDTLGFKQWSDGDTSLVRTVLPSEGLQLVAQF